MTVVALKAWFEEDPSVHKQIYVAKEQSCIDLHHGLMKAFHLTMIKTFFFYICDKEGRRLQRIVLNNPNKEENDLSMRDTLMKKLFKSLDDRLIYECNTKYYHWIFHLQPFELNQRKEPGRSYPHWIDSSGRTLMEAKPMLNESFFEGEYEYVDPKEEFGEDFEELDLGEEEMEDFAQ